MLRILKKTVKYFLLVFSILLSLVIFYLIVAVALSLMGTNPQKTECEKNMSLFVFSNGVHTDIAIPAEHLPYHLKEKLKIPEGTKIISFGWGDKEFYINTPEWKDLTVKTAFKALFLKSESALHITFYSDSNNYWNRLHLCPPQMDSMINYIENSFEVNENKEFIRVNVPGYSKLDVFFVSRKSFSLFRTCNVWTNKALKAANIKTSIWSPFDFGILYHAKPE